MNKNDFFDSCFDVSEQLPRQFTMSFEEVYINDRNGVRVIFNDNDQVGNIITDNAYENDYYRYHDVFHYTFATLLRWSPCTRALLKCKRKSNALIDEVEDGARATITEEAVSLIIFNEAKRVNYFEDVSGVSKTLLKTIRNITDIFEISIISSKDWERTILKAYEVFRFLINNNGGRVEFDSVNRTVKYSRLI